MKTTIKTQASYVWLPVIAISTVVSVFVIANFFSSGAEQQTATTLVPTDDLVTTSSGLQYVDVEVGSGLAPEDGRLVTIHYESWVMENGERGLKFDSSVDRGLPAPFTFKPEFYMKGFYEGISTMKVGGKRTLIITTDFYGSEWAPPTELAPAGSTLIFDIELLEVN